MLEQPLFVNNWWLVPIELDTSSIPQRACERVDAIYAAGLRPRGFIVAHEAPALLETPVRQGEPSREPLIGFEQLKQLFPKQLSAALARASSIRALGPPLLKCLEITAKGALAVLTFSGILLTMALVDPVLIAVTEDGYWVEIDRWDS